ncbi:slipin family protein [Apibacter sp. HY039]|uniref:slipin family protein n=1 Tax=Apibacter sp. HY039 TaxID=2501476 RepID=UPI000FEBB662|nr:slipin family protein [Apibacter sp. HY039]
MKRVRIITNTIGLVFKNGELIRILEKGSHWIFWKEILEIYDMEQPFNPYINLETLLLNENLKEKLHVFALADNEIGLVYKDKNFYTILEAGKHAFWKSNEGFSFTTVDLNSLEMDESIDKNLFTRDIFFKYIRTYQIQSYEKGLLFIDGKFEGLLEAGSYYWWKNNTTIHVVKSDVRKISMEIPGQEILTRDKAQLRINFTITYQVIDFVKALVENKDFDKQLYTCVQFALREYVGKLTFDELMDTKTEIASVVLALCADKAKKLGVELMDCGLKDIILPGEIKEIMNQVLIAEKKAQANSITRREETASTRSLLNTAKLMEENSMLWKLKEMEYMEKIADKIGEISLSGGGNTLEQLRTLFSK